jgi:glycosyltransferase involved in cell wall biosynthesis
LAVVRVFLCTYRRNELLRRAVASLLAQTFTDWVCELHNDDPGDPFPGKLVEELADPRIRMVTHPTNLGPTRTFNLMYREGLDESYVSLLEDDNWWEPDFLRVMIREMGNRPGIQVGWANMRIWEEQPDGGWRDTGRRVWNHLDTEEPMLFHWPNSRQVRGALHSQGAMLVRTDQITELQVPDSTPSAAIEPIRERRFRFPLLFIPTSLANFAITRTTSRGDDRVVWGQCQALLAASYLRHVRPGPDECRQIWANARTANPPATAALIAAGLIDHGARYALKYSRFVDWFRYLKGFARRPRVTMRVLKAKYALPSVWETLDTGTRMTHERANLQPSSQRRTESVQRVESPQSSH